MTHAIALIMKAIEATGKIDAQGQLTLDTPLRLTTPNQVRVIVLIPESEVELEQNDSGSKLVCVEQEAPYLVH